MVDSLSSLQFNGHHPDLCLGATGTMNWDGGGQTDWPLDARLYSSGELF